MSDQADSTNRPENRGLVERIGPLEIDWPRTAGYYGGIGLALAFELIEPPVGLFIAAVPFLKMLNQPGAPRPVRLVAQFFDGAAQPVGGSAPATISIAHDAAAQRHETHFLSEARQIADRVMHGQRERGGANTNARAADVTPA